MAKELKERYQSILLTKRSSAFILFVGFSFILLGIINNFKDIPDEYVISVSFAGAFFAISDLLAKYKPLNKFIINIYTVTLFLGVLSFIVLPTLLFIFPESVKILISNSESLSITSLGIVLIIININIWNSDDEIFAKIQEFTDDTGKVVKKFNKYIDARELEIAELKEKCEKLQVELEAEKNKIK